VTFVGCGIFDAKFDIACSRLSGQRVGNMASVRAGERQRRGWSSDLGSVDHRGCRRPQPHSGFLVGRRSRPVPAAQAVAARAEEHRQSLAIGRDRPVRRKRSDAELTALPNRDVS
jgi:hypothetical protein